MDAGPVARPEFLVISAVLPYPGSGGQQQRVRHTLRALRGHFRCTFLTVAPAAAVGSTLEKLAEHADESIVLRSRVTRTAVHRLTTQLAAFVYAGITGLKRSNYLIGRVDLSARRVADTLAGRSFACSLTEYWHLHECARMLAERGTPCVLDMHNILWKSYERQLSDVRWLPWAARRAYVAKYRDEEERAWSKYDLLVTINRAEHDYVSARLGGGTRVLYAPMGIDLAAWPFSWDPVSPPRIAYYGGLGSHHNQNDARVAAAEVMPRVWARHPCAEFWVVGSNPPEDIQRLARMDSRVRVTGFVANPQIVLRTMAAVVCPWTGTYGFRSRLVEVMALGVPVVTTADAVVGMELRAGEDLLVANSPEGLADGVVALLDAGLAARLSGQARKQVERLYSFEATYGALAAELGNRYARTSAQSPRVCSR